MTGGHNIVYCDDCIYCIRRVVKSYDEEKGTFMERDCGYDRTFLHCDDTVECNRHTTQAQIDAMEKKIDDRTT